MTRFPCPICGDPSAYPFWLDDEPPAGCPNDDAWQTDRGVPAIRNVTECRYQMRSEEHTSELQSLMRSSYAVYCWKKKTISIYTRTGDPLLHTRHPPTWYVF